MSLAHDRRVGEDIKTQRMAAMSRAERILYWSLWWHWDGTPITVSFGRLQDLVRPVARYWWRDALQGAHAESSEAGPWKLLTYDEYCARHSGKKSVSSGTLKMIAGKCRMQWVSEVFPTRTIKFFISS